MAKQTVIGLVGLPGAGKSTALSIIKKIAPVVIMGDIVRAEVIKSGAEINSKTLGDMSKIIRQLKGNTFLAEKCVDKIKTMKDGLIFIDGIRSMQEVKYFRKYWDLPIIAIICSDEIRHKRLLERGRKDDSLDIEKILGRDKREIGFGVDKVIIEAEFKIENDRDVHHLKKELMKIIRNFLTT